jgi:hypothetical protein
MPAKAGIHLFFQRGVLCLEMESGVRRNDKGGFGTDQARLITS